MNRLFNAQNEVVDEKYSRKMSAPQYVPSAKKPDISELYNIEKYSRLLYAINRANISEEDKNFLKLAASRHIVFNYSKIADYYAHADKELQTLMEQSALVILDIDDAIANGFVLLGKQIQKIMDESGKPTNEK